jgi:cytoskeletal protein CcmA (bactofilin family)
MNCCFEGEIYSKGVLIVGEHAVIKGTINVTSLINSGKIKRTITATEKVQLLKPAMLFGEVHALPFRWKKGRTFKVGSTWVSVLGRMIRPRTPPACMTWLLIERNQGQRQST